MILKKSKLLDLFHTAAADALALKQNDTVHVRAKRAGGLIFLQNFSLIIPPDQSFIPLEPIVSTILDCEKTNTMMGTSIITT